MSEKNLNSNDELEDSGSKSYSDSKRKAKGPKKLSKQTAVAENDESDFPPEAGFYYSREEVESPVSTDEDKNNRADEIRALYEEALDAVSQFKELNLAPMIKHLRELWVAKGLDPEDPAHLLFEGLGINDARQRMIFGKLFSVQEKSNRLILMVNEDMSKRASELGKLEHTLRKFYPLMEKLGNDHLALKKVNNDMLDASTQLIAPLAQLQAVLENRTLLVCIINWAVPALTLVTGFILRGFLQGTT